MAGLLARLRRSFERPKPPRRKTARPDVELLELRAQPATVIAPDLVAGSDTGLSSIDNVTSATTPRFAGTTTSPAGTTISLMVDGSDNGAYVVPLSGGSIFALEPATPLADGAHTIRFLDSHTHRLSAPLTIDVDTAAPDPSADFTLDPATGATTATSLIFDGTGEPGATATLFFDGAIEATVPVADDGTYQFVVDPVAFGSHEAYVTLTDMAGNTSPPSAPVDVSVVAPTPPIAVDAGTDQTVNEGDAVQLAASTNVPPVSETWTLVSATNGQAIDPVDGPDLAFVAASAGVFVFEHSATDAAGNVGTADVTVTALDVPPTLGLTGPATAIAGTEYDLSLSATDPGNELVTGWHVVWGDGATSDLAGIATTAPHVYAAAGTFTPTVTASQGAVTTSADGPTITVQLPPPPSLSQSLVPALLTAEDTTGDFAVSDVVAEVGVVGASGHTYGLAVDGVDDANGTWQYSLDDTNWSALSDASPTNARLLSEGSFLRFIPAADYDGPSQLSARVWDQADSSPAGSAVDLSAHVPFVSASDATIPLEVTPVNDPPTIALPPAQSMFRSQTLSFASVTPKITVADVDDPVLQVALDVDAGTLTAPANASVTATGSGTAHVELTGPTAALDSVLAGLVYAAPAAPGTEHLQVQVTDFAATGGLPQTTTATLVVTVADQAPTITSVPSYSVNANAVLAVATPDLASAYRDGDGDALQIRLSNAPSVGTVVVHADGSFTYTPPTGYVGVVQFSVEAWDGYALSSPLLVAIDVKSIYGLRR